MLSDFLLQAQSAHGNRYSYHLVEYVNMVTKVKIECSTHGEFNQYPFHHVKGAGCKKCGIQQRVEKQRLDPAIKSDRKAQHTLEVAEAKKAKTALLGQNFIVKATEVHNNRYDYSEVIYETLQRPVSIICPEHGPFNQRPANHYRGQGCPKCVGHVSRKETEWLDSLGIQNRQVCHFVNGRKFIFDGFCKETNTVYMFHGDYWHGNPKVYNQLKTHPLLKKTYGDLYQATIESEIFLKTAGFNIISIWELDFNPKTA